MLKLFTEAQILSRPYKVLVPGVPGDLPCSWETIQSLSVSASFGNFYRCTTKQLAGFTLFRPCNARPRCNQLQISACTAEQNPTIQTGKSSLTSSCNSETMLMSENSPRIRKPLSELSNMQQQPKAVTKHFVLQPWQRQLLLDKKGKRIKAIREQVHPVSVKLLAAPFDRKTLILRIEGNSSGVNHACSLFTHLFKDLSGGTSTYGDHVLVPY